MISSSFYEGNEANYVLLVEVFMTVLQPDVFIKDAIKKLKVEIPGKDLESSELELSLRTECIWFGNNIVIKLISLDRS